MCFRENNNGKSKREYKRDVNVIIVFHDVNLALYTVTNIYPREGCSITVPLVKT